VLIPPQLNNDHQVIKNLLKALLALVVVAIIIWVYRQQTTGELSNKVSMLTQQNTELHSQNTTLTTQYNDLINDTRHQQQTEAIQKATNTELLQQLTELQDNVIELNKELNFYQNITQGSATSKLQIRELKVIADSKKADQFHYRLVMSQGKKITKPITGQLSITVVGQVDKKPETIKANQHQLKLRHVQVFTGQIKLAENMAPKSIKITLIQNKKTTLSRTLDWNVTTSPTQLER